MSLSDDIAADYRDFDGLEAVDLKRARPEGSSTTTIEYTDSNGDSQPAALRRQLGRSDRVAMGALANESDSTIWELPSEIVGAWGVRAGDKIVETDGTVWRVVRADLASLRTRWRCMCTEQQ